MSADAPLALLDEYKAACDAFANGLRAVGDRWDGPTPAKEGNAGQVVDHVIGSHERLLLRPLELTPLRSSDGRNEHWTAIVDVLVPALDRPGALDGRELLLGVLATDVLVHSWDLSCSSGTHAPLDPALCQAGYERAIANRKLLEDAGAIERQNAVPDDAPIQDRLLGLFGRNPDWCYPAS